MTLRFRTTRPNFRRAPRGGGRRAGPFAVLAAALLLFSGAPASTQEGDAPLPEPSPEVERARAMLFDDPAAALGVLRPLAEAAPDDTDAWFFRGLAASRLANLPADRPGAPADDAARRALLDEAAASYRHILERLPGLAGARLELARVLFERGRCLEEPEDLVEHLMGDDCDAAAHHFERALAGDLPPEIEAAVSRFLALVRERRRIQGSFSLAVAPDSNVNAGPSARTFESRITNFFTGEPLEFEIDEGARAKSGVGIVLSASGEYRHPMRFRSMDAAVARLRLGAGVHRRDYPERRFDRMTLSAHVGPQLLFPLAQVSVLAKVDRNWSGGELASFGIGPRVEGSLRLFERLWLDAGAERIDLRHRREADQRSDGPRVDYDLGLSYAATPALLFGLRGGLERARPKATGQRSRTRRLGGFASLDLPPILGVSGFTVGVFRDALFTRYDDQRHFLISVKNRRDRIGMERLTVSNDRLELFGFAPVLSLVRERRDSNIGGVFDYRRNRAELSFRQLF